MFAVGKAGSTLAQTIHFIHIRLIEKVVRTQLNIRNTA